MQLAIGQGDLLVTPLQMTRFYALIANGGKLVEPARGQEIEQPAGEGEPPVVLRTFTRRSRRSTPGSAGRDPVVQEWLYDATHDAVRHLHGVFGVYAVPIAGKTGTAEKFVTMPKGY